jgi:hypothetical protein
MSETELLTVKNPEPLREIDAILAKYDEQKTSVSARFENLSLTCNAIGELRHRLPDDLVRKFKENAENNRLGFRTDKPGIGYPIPVIRDCMIDAVLMGVYPYGNEFNIVASNAYITKEGFTGMMRRDKRFSDIRIECDVPNYEDARSGSDLRAIVPFKATWKFNGKPDSLNGNIPIRVNRGMGDDAILGKSERKIRARIWSIATGSSISDGDADDSGTSGRAERAKPVAAEVASVESMTGGEAVDKEDDVPYAENEKAAKPAPAKAHEASAHAATKPAPSPEPRKKIVHDSPSHKEILNLCVKSQVLPEIVAEYAASMGFAPAGAESVSEIGEEGALEIASHWNGIASILKNRSEERRAARDDSGR